jgi:hypothetical protein
MGLCAEFWMIADGFIKTAANLPDGKRFNRYPLLVEGSSFTMSHEPLAISHELWAGRPGALPTHHKPHTTTLAAAAPPPEKI